MEGLVILAIGIVLVVVLDMAAIAFGVDSRDGVDARQGFLG